MKKIVTVLIGIVMCASGFSEEITRQYFSPVYKTKINDDKVNVRILPGIRYKKVSQLNRGDIVLVTGISSKREVIDNYDGYGQVSIEAIVKAVGVPHVTVIRPYRIKKSITSIKDALDYEGVSVIISRETCSLYARALKMARGKPFFVSTKCKNHRDCINDLACPAFFIEDERVNIDASICMGCSVCAQICPENAIVPLKEIT